MASAGNRNTTLTPTYYEEDDLGKVGGSNILNSGIGNVYTISVTKPASNVAVIKLYDATTFVYGDTTSGNPDVVITMSSAATSMVIASKSGIPFETGVCIAAGQVGGTATGGDSDPAGQTQVELLGD